MPYLAMNLKNILSVYLGQWDIKAKLLQAKLYYNKNVSLSAVQEAKASLDYYVADKAVVITNSHFTKSAYELALSTGVALIDREKLITLIQADKKQKRILFERYTII